MNRIRESAALRKYPWGVMRLADGPQVIGVASGKGGVGKTAVSVNLAVALAQRGHRVMLFDADLGLANAQIALGCRTEFNFSHVLAGTHSLEDIIVTTRQGIRLVPGASGVAELASLGPVESAAIVDAFGGLREELDYLIVDAAAGIADSVTMFMRAAHHRLIVVRDEPSSIADAYGIIKVLMKDFRLEHIHVVPNMVASQGAGRQLHQRINDVCRRFLEHEVGYLESIAHDDHMLSAIRAYKTVMEHAPGGTAARDFRRLAAAVETLPRPQDATGGIQFFLERLLNGAT